MILRFPIYYQDLSYDIRRHISMSVYEVLSPKEQVSLETHNRIADLVEKTCEEAKVDLLIEVGGYEDNKAGENSEHK